MKKFTLISLTTLLVLIACTRVPITGRKQTNLLSEQELMSESLTQYRSFLKEHKAVTNTADARTIRRVGQRLSKAVEQYLKANNFSDRIEGYTWEFNLVQDDVANAWCMPGGKIVFYTGIMPICKDETGVAVVMGHEIAHAIARHGNERISQQLLIAGLGAGLDAWMQVKQTPEKSRQIFMGAYGIGSAVGVSLPFSRKHESEADKMGLVFMALAGYDPRGAANFWKRMADNSSGQPPEFLSTHPSHDTRIEEINAYLPKALKHYKP